MSIIFIFQNIKSSIPEKYTGNNNVESESSRYCKYACHQDRNNWTFTGISPFSTICVSGNNPFCYPFTSGNLNYWTHYGALEAPKQQYALFFTNIFICDLFTLFVHLLLKIITFSIYVIYHPFQLHVKYVYWQNNSW